MDITSACVRAQSIARAKFLAWPSGTRSRPFSSRRRSRSNATRNPPKDRNLLQLLAEGLRSECVSSLGITQPFQIRTTLSATRSVTAGYSTTADAIDLERGSVTLMVSHRTSRARRDGPRANNLL